MDSNALKHWAGQHKIFLQTLSSPSSHYFSTFAIDNGSLYIRFWLGSLNFSGSSPCGIRMCDSQRLSMENKTTCGRRVKRGTTKVTETVTETLNRALLGGERR